jgi:hypothetical protein
MRVKKNTLSFPHFIYSDDYFITNLDIWVMMQRHKIPSVIVSSKPIILTNREKNNLVLYGSPENNFVFIYAPALRAENIPKYSIIISAKDGIQQPLDVFRAEESKREIISSIEINFTLEKMFQKFKKNPDGESDKKEKAPKKRIQLAIQEDDDEEPEPSPKIKIESKTKKQAITKKAKTQKKSPK